MAIGAAEQALNRAKLTIGDIDTVVVATITYPHQAPSAATAIIQRMGNPTAAAFDISAACAGFCYGVAMAHDMVRAGSAFQAATQWHLRRPPIEAMGGNAH